MILNEIHVDIARNVLQKDVYSDLSEKLTEVRGMLLEIAYGTVRQALSYNPENVSHTGPMPEINWHNFNPSDGC